MLLQDGVSALSVALYNGHEDLAHLLLAADADIKITDNVRNVPCVNTSRDVMCQIVYICHVVKQIEYHNNLSVQWRVDYLLTIVGIITC